LVLLLASFTSPLLILYLVFGGVVLISFVVPIWFVLQSERFSKVLDGVFERVSFLMIFYLFLDVIAIIIVAWRNNLWLSL
jgi:phosphate starvation-inducible membrane PsiE